MHDTSMQREKAYIYGKHALKEALEGKPEAIQKVFAAKNALDSALLSQLRALGVSVSDMKEQRTVAEDAAHQGVIAAIDPSKILLSDIEQFLATLDLSKNPCLILMDELQDPQNVGAIIRSAAAFGASGILMPQNNQAQVTGAVVKTSAGMTFRMPLVSIGNVNQTVRLLKDRGFWVYGLAMEGASELSTETFNAPAVFVVGNEGEGIRQKTLELCDVKLSIPMHPRTESLNAAVSAAIVIYEWSKQHRGALAA